MSNDLIEAVAFTKVAVHDAFWRPRLETNRRVTLPYALNKCEETGRIRNFDRAAGTLAGPHEGIFFNDSDVFKVLEGAAYSLKLQPDPELEHEVDRIIAKIAAAQEIDGYLYTARSTDPAAVSAEGEGLHRWSNLRFSHELYNVGHLYEAAVAYAQATGKRRLLTVAFKNADLIAREFGPDARRDVPGHQEIELGLVKLYLFSGDRKYLNLAKFFLDERGHAHDRDLYTVPDNPGYLQDHLPVTEQTEAVGHAVRAGYMYSAMADVAALTGEPDYLGALGALWTDVSSSKLYLTGGIGARHHREAFGDAFELPNQTAYNETCAAIANMFWNERMFALKGDAKYIDVLERTLYNGFLAGVSLSGDRFFYPNPLASDGVWAFNFRTNATRSPWFDTSCCPTNIVRFLPALPEYVYAQRDNTLYVKLYLSSEVQAELADGEVKLRQETAYPWEGTVKLIVKASAGCFTLALRIPGWARGKPVPSDLYHYLDDPRLPVTVRVNGGEVMYQTDKGFIHLTRDWAVNDEIEINLPMPVQRVGSRAEVAENLGRVAVERGPLVYCAEAADNNGQISGLVVADKDAFRVVSAPDLLGGINVLECDSATLVPYYAWSHRGIGEMAVWLRRNPQLKSGYES